MFYPDTSRHFLIIKPTLDIIIKKKCKEGTLGRKALSRLRKWKQNDIMPGS